MNPQPREAPQDILIFGGTFDPPQLAHVALPREAARLLRCSRTLIVPTSTNPLKRDSPASAEHRVAMLRLVIEAVPGAELCLTEADSTGPSYTVETLTLLRHRFGPLAAMFLLMGSDSALSFDRWREPHRILELATPAVALRPPESRESFGRALRRIHDSATADFWMRCLLDLPMVDVSSTDVRRRLAAGEPLGDLLDSKVERYIRSHGLYGAGPMSLEGGEGARSSG